VHGLKSVELTITDGSIAEVDQTCKKVSTSGHPEKSTRRFLGHDFACTELGDFKA
jgi:hypothetical protein